MDVSTYVQMMHTTFGRRPAYILPSRRVNKRNRKSTSIHDITRTTMDSFRIFRPTINDGHRDGCDDGAGSDAFVVVAVAVVAAVEIAIAVAVVGEHATVASDVDAAVAAFVDGRSNDAHVRDHARDHVREGMVEQSPQQREQRPPPAEQVGEAMALGHCRSHLRHLRLLRLDATLFRYRVPS